MTVLRGTRDHRIGNGFTILELLVALGISSTLLLALASYFSDTVSQARDHQIRLQAISEVQSAVQTIVSELRMLGNGVPFDQSNFQIGESTLSDPTVTEPLLVASAAADSVTFRLNETGEVAIISAAFDPVASLVVSLSETKRLAAGDIVYISNGVVSGDEGLYGIIASVDSGANTITLTSGFITTSGAIFVAGSILEEVHLITYASLSDGSGITRDNGAGAVLIARDSTMSLDYLDYTGSEITLPLVAANLIDDLRSIRVSITKTSDVALSSGSVHTVTMNQTIGIRNLSYLF